jgi:uroporphyrinogen-III synthase
MAILITRPQPDNDTTSAALRGRGLVVLAAPMLRFEQMPFQDDADAKYGAAIVTSANALRAIADQPVRDSLIKLPLFAVGDKTADAARELGFADVISADGDANALRELMVASVKAKRLKKSSTLLYLAGADLARDLAGELGGRGFSVVTHTTYRMAPVTSLPPDVVAALATGGIEAVLHYSRRSARAFFTAAQAAAVEISALATLHGCLSDSIASVARDAGATQVMVARTPDEPALFNLLGRANAPLSR